MHLWPVWRHTKHFLKLIIFALMAPLASYKKIKLQDIFKALKIT